MKPCNGGLPTPSDPCFNASCARCKRHRIDTSSIGRHMVRVDDETLICHDCAPELPSPDPSHREA